MKNVKTRIHLKNGLTKEIDGLVDQSIDDAIVGISKAKASNGMVNLYDMDGSEPVPASEINSIEIIFKN